MLTSKEESESLWYEWVRLALQSKVQEITKFAKVQNRRYRDGITNSGIYRIRTSVLEGINNKIKVWLIAKSVGSLENNIQN